MRFAASWMNLETVILSDGGQTQKDKYMIVLACGNPKKSTSRLTYKMESQNRVTDVDKVGEG